MRLGLGLGLNKGGNLLSNLKLLTRNSDWAIWGDKATGTSKGTNTPQVNTIVDLVGTADGTLTGFAFTGASGYVDVVAPNGKTVTGIQGDGVNDVIVLPSNAPNPVGLQDFGFAFVFKYTRDTTVKTVISRRGTIIQYRLYYFDGVLYFNFGGTLIASANNVLSTGIHKVVVKRKNNVVSLILDGVTVGTSSVSTSLVSQPYTSLMATTTDGVAYSTFDNGILLYDNYNNGDNIDAWEADQNKGILKAYGL